MTSENDPQDGYHHEGENPSVEGRHRAEIVSDADARGYWRANLRLLGLLLFIWAFVSFGLSIFFVEILNQVSFFGFKFGFWWAQQGSIYVFICLIFYCVHAMKRLERAYGVDDDV